MKEVRRLACRILLHAGLAGTLLPLAGPALSRPTSTEELRGAEIRVVRSSGPIRVDGDLSDAGWAGAARVETFYEVNPGDNVPPKVRTVALLAYDERYLYVAFECDDPDPRRIRAPYTDRDELRGDTDYAGVILDTVFDGRTAVELLANPRGIQFDAVTNDGEEDVAPDFFWDSAGRVTETGWTLEIRVPFTTLRYKRADPQTWGILLYRNWPREYRYQMFSARLPRGRNCFVCSENVLSGLSGLPPGGHLVAAPYVSAAQEAVPRDPPGTGLVTRPIDPEAGLDVKWTPNAVTAVDATFNPDFSQIESDVAQIGVNERFALFYPEKRPFFLEGVDLLTSTPIQAVYTRTITSPRWGLRGTGKLDSTAWTLLVADDRGGGSVVVPGPTGSDLAEQDFRSFVAVGRARHDIGRSFASLLFTDREVRGGGYNRVLGPDFQWRPSEADTVTGQLLFSRSVTPDRPDLAAEWDGRTLTGHAARIWWSHSTERIDWFAVYKDFDDDFRADVGFVPQVGFREGYLEGGYTWRPTGFFRRVRLFLESELQVDRDGADTIYRQVQVGVGADGRSNSFYRIELETEAVRTGESLLPRKTVSLSYQVVPSSVFGQTSLEASWGQEIDYAGERNGHGGGLALTSVVRPTDHLALEALGELQWLDVPREEGGPEERLFTAFVARLKATYTFSARSFLRVIGQYVGARYDPTLYPDPASVPSREGSFSASALLAYKLNWQSVVYVGYGDARTLDETGGLPPQNRQLFVKVSYAFQR